jgi:energy-coupling factor transporter ATP-binding protein EcfA2
MPIDARLLQWFAVELILNSRARLVEGGAGGDTRIDLANVFVDLPAIALCDHHSLPDEVAIVQWICQEPEINEEIERLRPRAVVVGGPGSGKSTVTTMVGQLLRLEHLRGRFDELPSHLHSRAREVANGLEALRERIGLVGGSGMLPLRVNLPDLARSIPEALAHDPAEVLWRYLASRVAEHTANFGLTFKLDAAELAVQVHAYPAVLWIFDGLDEVPRSAGRDHVIAVIRAASGGHSRGGHSRQRVVVTTRPQGYDGEFGDLDELVLSELPSQLALDYGLRLLRAWSGNEDPQLSEKLTSLKEELDKPAVQALVRTPLHTTMAALLVAEEGTLPSARHLLFEHYFDTIFKRELRKRGEHRVRTEDKARLKTLHARAGLALHVRSQGRAGARPMLATRELRAILETILREEQQSPEDVQAIAERMLRFAADRLVLLLRVTEGGYSFSIRSLQEFFAAMALREGEVSEVRRRLEIIALNPHWSNVLSLTTSWAAVSSPTQREKVAALEYTQGLCRALNDGTLGGRSASVCVTGSRLAIAILRETERCGEPWLHDPLWAIALEAASAPLQTRSARHARSAPRQEAASAQWDDDLELHVRLGTLAERWASGGPNKWLPYMLQTAETLLERNPPHASIAWRLLLAGLQRADPRATRVAEAHAPHTGELAQQMVLAASVQDQVVIPAWFETFANDHADWFPPTWIAAHRPHYLRNGPQSGVLAVWTLSDSFPGGDLDVAVGEHVECNLWSIDRAAAAWSKATLPIAGTSAEWQAWHALAAFHASPSKVSLANALEAIASSGSLLQYLSNARIAWPILDCLAFVASAAELTSLASSARAGELGDIEDWSAAEHRWVSNPSVSDDDVRDWISARELPWSRDIATRGRVFSFKMTRGERYDHSTFEREATRACAVLRDHASYARRPTEWLRSMLLWRISTSTPLTDMVPLEVAAGAPDLTDRHPWLALYQVALLIPDLSGPSADGWFKLFDERGKLGRNRSCPLGWGGDRARLELSRLVDALVRRVLIHPDQWGLVDALWAAVSSLPAGIVTESLTALPPPRLPPDASARLRASAAALTLVTRSTADLDVSALLAALASKDEGFDLRPQLVGVLESETDPARATELLLQLLDTTTDDDEDLRDVILGALFQHLKRAAPLAFATAEAWKQSNLPEPFLSGQAPDVQPPRIVQLAELSNIRLFKETPAIDAPLPQPEIDQGQWIVVVGENGVGKTTLLRAIGLALAGPTVATRLLDESQPFVRNGGDGRIAIELDTGKVEIIVRRDARTEVVVSAGDDKVTPPWVVGYGVRRGTARGEKDRTPEWGPTGELHTLFDRPATLVNAVDWLLDLDRRRLNEERQFPPGRDDEGLRGHAATWQSVERALNALLGITAIEPEDRHVMVTHPVLGRVRLDALSDGYLTTTGWVIDLIARWIQRQEDLRETVGHDLLRQMTGIVLIDEIDLHLHPTWQMRIIDDVRRLFPRLSFVVTTHNPLTLHGARPGEIFVMRRGDGGRIELTQRDIRPGHDVDRVLFEQFGIRYTFDHETTVMLERHRTLMENGAAVDAPDRVELERALATRLGRVGEVLAEERGEEHGPVRRWTDEDRRLFDEYAKGKG